MTAPALLQEQARCLAAVPLIWLKFNETFGLVGVSGGHARADVDKHFSASEIELLLGNGTYAQLLSADRTRDEDVLDTIMRLSGWQPDDELFVSNGDVFAHAYRRLEPVEA